MIKKTIAILALMSSIAVSNAATYDISGNLVNGGNTGENSLYLGFYSADEVSTKSVLINLGTSADVINGLSLNLTSHTALTGTFGANWFNNSQVYWGLLGYDGGYGEYGSFYVARPTSQPLLQTDVNGSTALSDDQYWVLSDNVGALTTAHTAGAAELSYINGSTGNTHQISVVDNSPTSFKGTAELNFNTFTSAVYEQITGGLSIQQFDGSSSFATAADGTFATISQLNGVVSAGSVVPEPSTYALFVLGGLILILSVRRRIA